MKFFTKHPHIKHFCQIAITMAYVILIARGCSHAIDNYIQSPTEVSAIAHWVMTTFKMPNIPNAIGAIFTIGGIMLYILGVLVCQAIANPQGSNLKDDLNSVLKDLKEI